MKFMTLFGAASSFGTLAVFRDAVETLKKYWRCTSSQKV
jgi:hypothetical protein